MILPASIAEPPPTAMMQSGSKRAISLAPHVRTQRRIGLDVVEAVVGDAHLVELVGDGPGVAILVEELVGDDEGRSCP